MARLLYEYWHEKVSFIYSLLRSTLFIDSRSSSVSIGTRLGDRGSILGKCRERIVFLLAAASRPVLWPTQSPIRCVPGSLSQGVKCKCAVEKKATCRSCPRRDSKQALQNADLIILLLAWVIVTIRPDKNSYHYKLYVSTAHTPMLKVSDWNSKKNMLPLILCFVSFFTYRVHKMDACHVRPFVCSVIKTIIEFGVSEWMGEICQLNLVFAPCTSSWRGA
jgi:hypothetical protein